MTDRISADHLKRAAIVYVRQSSPEQVRNHAESTRIQVGLREKAVAFGWRDPVIILDDLGISAGGFAQRAGFQHMAAEVSLGHVGIILCFEASRLSAVATRRGAAPVWLLISTLGLLLAAAADVRAQGMSGAFGDKPIPNPPGGDATVTVDGETRKQPVGHAEVEIAVDLDGSDEAQVGKPYTLIVTVHNRSPSTAANVRVPIALAVTTAAGAVTPARNGIRYAGSGSIECTRSGDVRLCAFGDIPSGETRTASILVEIDAAARPGQMTFSTTAQTDSRVGEGSRVRPQKAVALVLSARRRVDVDLHLSLVRAAEIVGPGERFSYVLEVRNASVGSEATDVELELGYRTGVRERGKFRRIANGARAVVSGEPAPQCAEAAADVQRCRLGTMRPGDVRRVVVELAVVQEFAPGRWGRTEIESRVWSAENDPNGANNAARAFTNVVSRLPEIAIVTRIRNDRGELVTAAVQTLAPGQVFGIEVRFMTLAVEPTGVEPWVRVSVDGGEALHIAVAQSDKSASDRVFRSSLLRVVAAGQPPPAGDETVRIVRAGAGKTIRVIYELGQPTGGPTRTEVAVTVRPASAPRPGAPARPR